MSENSQNMNIQKSKTSSDFLVDNRELFLVSRCKDKNVLHIGCVGTRNNKDSLSLHEKIFSVSKNVIGIDVWEEGINDLKEKNKSLNILKANAEDLSKIKFDFNIDVIIMGEVLEHIGNPFQALTEMKKLISEHNCKLVITVPNAFGFRNFISMLVSHKEITRLDHYAYYSFVTLNSLLRDVGLNVSSVGYYSLLTSRSMLSRLMKNILLNKFLYKLRPGLSEGLIFEISRD